MVMFQHYVSLKADLRWGWTGVRIFFVLSGFLITGILYDTRNAEKRWSVFYARRSLRIFPLYYAVLLLGVVLYPVCRWVLHPSQLLWPFYLQNYARFIWPQDVPSGVVDHLRVNRPGVYPFFLFYGHLWSLAIEEQFYLVWPLVVFAIKRRETLMRVCLVVIVLSPIARFICALAVPHTLIVAGFLERFTFLQCDSLLMGGFCALWLRGPHPDFTRLAHWLVASLIVITFMSDLVCQHLYHRHLEPAIGDEIFGSIGFTLVNLGSTALVLLAIDSRTFLSRLLQNRALRYIGTISYGFYVFHDIPHFFYLYAAQTIGHHRPDVLALIIGFLGTLLLASASYYGFERPFLRLKSRFTIRTGPRPEVLA